VWLSAIAAAQSGEKTVGDIQAVLTLEPGEGNPRNSEGDFIALKDGRVLYVYTHFTGSASDFGAAHLAGRYSSDGGRTWTADDVRILENEGKINTMSVSLLRLRSGAIAFFYLVKESHGDCRCYLRISNDEAQTWSERICCTEPIAYYVVNNDRIVQLSSGRLLIPAARHCLPGEEFQGRGSAMCFFSDDEGKTWQASESILEAPENSRTGLQEPGVIELRDGRIMMLSRTDLGCQYRSYSEDGGVTWSLAEPTDIESPVAPASFERIPSTGGIVLVWNDHSHIDPALKGKRTPLSIAVSRDEGQTWQKVRDIETNPEGWYCYTAIDFVDDAMLLGYCAGDSTVGGLNRTRIARIDIDDLVP